jgi:hypothetical protein
VSLDGPHQPVFCHDLTHEGGAPMTTMTLPVAADHGTRLRAEVVVPMYERAWKQRSSVVILGGFGTDNSTGVSAEERRHL